MSNEVRKCPKCKGEMAEGFMLDTANTSNPWGFNRWFSQVRWVHGKPEKSKGSGVKWKDKEAFLVAAYRCANCGFVEHYAVEPSKYPDMP